MKGYGCEARIGTHYRDIQCGRREEEYNPDGSIRSVHEGRLMCGEKLARVVPPKSWSQSHSADPDGADAEVLLNPGRTERDGVWQLTTTASDRLARDKALASSDRAKDRKLQEDAKRRLRRNASSRNRRGEIQPEGERAQIS